MTDSEYLKQKFWILESFDFLESELKHFRRILQ